MMAAVRSSTSGRVIVGAAFAALLTVSSAACSSQSEPATTDIESFVAAFGGDVGDYDPVRSPQELAKKSELVVEGEILDLVEGRSFGSSNEADDIIGTTAVFQVQVSKVLQGDLPAGSDNLVYVEKFGIQEPAKYAAQLPEKNSSLFYLYPAWEGTIIPGSPVVNDGAGHPKGQPLFSFETQGYLMQGENSVFQVIDGVEFPGATLADFSPEARTFPPTAEELQEASD